MEFEWDEQKNLINLEKHGVSFRRASLIFEHPVITAIDDRHSYGEIRRISVGMAAPGEILTVVHTERGNRIRIISARPASRQERKHYDQAPF